MANTITIVLAAFIVMAVPGILLLLVARLEGPLTLLETAGVGVALSVGIVTLLTILCMTTHLSFAWAALSIVVAAVLLGTVAVTRRPDRLTTVVVPVSEWWLLGGVMVVAVLLFLRGSPLWQGEDQIHLAVIRRLAALAHPSVSTIYMTPDLVYTYPFPSIHALTALTSVVSGVDPLLVYHKLRFAWGAMALLAVYVSAKRLFDDIRVARICGWTAIVFVANGLWGDVAPLMWAQMAPFTHMTDTAMGAMTPLLLVAALCYLGSDHRRDRIVFLVAALLMVLALTTGKIREIVQFVVYTTSFLAAVLMFGPRRPLVARTAALLVPTLAIVGSYAIYHRMTAAEVGAVVDANRIQILEMWRHMTWQDHVMRPLNDGKIVNNFNLFFHNLHPVVLLGAPLVFAAFLRRRLLLFVWAGIFAYVLIVRIPVLSFGYLLATYFDMLSTPVRNVVFFIYVLAGALVYLAAVLLSRVRFFPLALLPASGLIFWLPEGVGWLRGAMTANVDVLFASLLLGMPLALWANSTARAREFE